MPPPSLNSPRRTALLEPVAAPFAPLAARWGQLHGNIRGMFVVALAGLALSLMATVIKYTGQRIPVIQILFIRQIVMTLFMTPRILRSPREAFRTSNLKLHVLRVSLSIVAMTAGFTATVHLALPDSVAISFSKSFFVAIFAILILHESVGRHRWFAVILGFVGVMIMARPSGEGLGFYAFLGLLSSAAVGLIMVIIRKLAQKEKLATVITYQAVGLGVLFSVPAFIVWVPPTPTEWALLLLTGVLSTGAQSLNFMGFRMGEATALAPVDYLRLIYATALGALIFSEWPSVTTLIGAVVIISTSLYAMRQENRAARRNHGPLAQQD